ncbi:MAG TPA: hypothetical protein VGO91_13690 [Pyrinomonadaceae bacterium]|jgi:hypothetical protein|nr:hypothetical protein [Pyrinomonadaceae bacterium]
MKGRAINKIAIVHWLAWSFIALSIIAMVRVAMTHKETIFGPEFIIGALGIVVAIAALVVTETTLKDVSGHLDETFSKLDGTLGEIKEQEKRLEDDINNLEDATRKNLSSFAEIFERSLWLLEQAEREVVYANFVLGFGYAHMRNEHIRKDYESLPNRRELTFEKAINKFWNTLREKVYTHRITKLKFVTLDEDNMKAEFLEQLARRDEYKYLKEEGFRKETCEREETCRKILASALKDRARDWETPDTDLELEWRVGHRLPIQVLIAGLPPRQGQPQETRFGCIVFLLGTESLAGIKAPGSARGFYTELQHIIDMYSEFVDNAAETFPKKHPHPEVKLLSS